MEIYIAINSTKLSHELTKDISGQLYHTIDQELYTELDKEIQELFVNKIDELINEQYRISRKSYARNA